MSISDLPDPFEVIGAIPKDKSYQWMVESVLGDTGEDIDWIIAKVGWSPVPPERHPEMPEVRHCIRFGGCVLMERSAEKAEAAHREEIKKAHDFAAHLKPDKDGVVDLRTVKSQPYDEATEPVTVDVTVPLQLSPRLVTAANYCDITPEEYGRRVIALMLQGSLNYMLLPTEDRKAFEFFDRLIVSRPDRGNTHG